MLTGALLGFGEEAESVYAPALTDPACGLRVAAIACAAPREAAAAAAAFPEAKLYEDIPSLLSDQKGLRFALASVPARLRADALRLALKAGLDAGAHPPFPDTPSEIPLARLAASAGRRLQVLHPWEKSLPWSSLSRTLTEGFTGGVTYAEIRIMTPRLAGAGPENGVTAALGWQAFAMLSDLVRLPPRAVSARLGSGADYNPEAVEGEADIRVHYSGATASIRLASGAFAPHFRAEVSGPRGLARLEGGRLTREAAGGPPSELNFGESLDDGLARRAWMLAELHDFAQALQNKAPPEAGRRNHELCARLLKNCYYSASVRSAAVPL